MDTIRLIVIGLLLGWLIEWVIDWMFWRGQEAEGGNPYTPPNLTYPRNAPTKKQLQAKIQRLKSKEFENPWLADVLASMLANSVGTNDSDETVADKMQVGMASWFDDVMNRTTGEYKRKATRWAWLLGTILAIAFNVDSIQIATRMWREPTLRQVIVAGAANDRGAEAQPSLNEFVDQVNQLGIPVGWTTVPKTDGQTCGWTPGKEVYPAIWTNDSCRILLNLPSMDDGWGWIWKFFGLLISGLATAQGAPFWFDVLKKLINIRTSGPRPQPARNNNPNIS